MRNIKYSCQNEAKRFTLMSPLKDYPLPKNGVYFWHLCNIPKGANKYKVILAFTNVIKKWQRAVDLTAPFEVKISFESTPDIKQADFVFSFGHGIHKYYCKDGEGTCPFNFDAAGGVLAHAWSLQASDKMRGQAHFDSHERWGEMETDLETVALHEIGHCLGIGHSEDKDAIMYPAYTGAKNGLGKDDYKAIKFIFSDVKKRMQPNNTEKISWFKRLIRFLLY